MAILGEPALASFPLIFFLYLSLYYLSLHY